jgi:hypothetical protein
VYNHSRILFPMGKFQPVLSAIVKFSLGNTRRFRNAAGPHIRKFRVARELSQDQLAAKVQLLGLDIDRVTIAKIESQIRSLYDFELAVIAAALNISTAELGLREKDFATLLPPLMKGQVSIRKKH